MKRIAVLVSGGGTNLQALLDSKISNGQIVLVVSSNPGAYALNRAKNHSIETIVVERKLYKNNYVFSQKLLKILADKSIDLIVLAGFMSILTKSFIKSYPDRIINVHPSLIPSFCGKGYYGLKVHDRALKKGVKVSGATVHFVNEIPDGGAIILQKTVKIEPYDTPESLQKRIMLEAEQKILPKAVNLFCDGRLFVKDGTVHIK